jgi:hypothetical protein
MKAISSRVAALLALLALLAGCVVYDPYYPPPGGPGVFDRSWNAALGAFSDQGVQTTAVDRTNGVISGRKGGISMNARVLTQADGRVRVEFNAGGALSEDPGLPDRVSRAYDARMGR